jgi:chaperonin GroES
MNIKPLADRILIEPISSEEKTKSGIVLPDTAEKERPEQGKVVAVGPGKILDNGSRQKIELEKGDIVLFSKYGPTEIKIDDKEYLIAREDDILAVVIAKR